MNDCVVAPPENDPAPDAERVSATVATPFPNRSVNLTVTGTPSPLALPVVPPVTVIKRASAAAFPATIACEVETVPAVAV